MNVAVILAGGVGSRLGANIPKQYIEIKGKPIIAYTLEKFQSFKNIDAIEVVCAKKYKEYVWSLAKKYSISKLKWVAEGGSTAQESIRNGVFSLHNILNEDDMLIFHMSVSPMINEETINDSIRVCREHGNAFALQPCLFCLCKKTTSEYSEENAYKEEYVGVNMPWNIMYGEAYSLYQDAYSNGIGTAENDYLPSLLLKYGKRLYFCKDNDENRLKITTRADLDFFEAYLILEEKRQHNNGRLS